MPLLLHVCLLFTLLHISFGLNYEETDPSLLSYQEGFVVVNDDDHFFDHVLIKRDANVEESDDIGSGHLEDIKDDTTLLKSVVPTQNDSENKAADDAPNTSSNIQLEEAHDHHQHPQKLNDNPEGQVISEDTAPSNIEAGPVHDHDKLQEGVDVVKQTDPTKVPDTQSNDFKNETLQNAPESTEVEKQNQTSSDDAQHFEHATSSNASAEVKSDEEGNQNQTVADDAEHAKLATSPSVSVDANVPHLHHGADVKSDEESNQNRTAADVAENAKHATSSNESADVSVPHLHHEESNQNQTADDTAHASADASVPHLHHEESNQNQTADDTAHAQHIIPSVEVGNETSVKNQTQTKVGDVGDMKKETEVADKDVTAAVTSGTLTQDDGKKPGGRSAIEVKKENDLNGDEVNKTRGSTDDPKKAGGKDTTILIVLFVAVVVVGALAFGYNYIKKRKQANNTTTDSENPRNVYKSTKLEEKPEEKPLMGENKNIEMKTMNSHEGSTSKSVAPT